MRRGVNIVKLLVGVLFIVSGLVKANDPLGLSYKMQEFFEVWTTDLAAAPHLLKSGLTALLTFSNAHTLALSISMIALEIMAGVALLLGWQKRFVLWLLLVLIIFFTFLTGYAFASGKFKNCGCFGDCLPITPGVSFAKDLLLLAAILFLFFKRSYIQVSFSKGAQWGVLGVALVVSLGLQAYVLRYLPVADCLPYKKGANITQGMQPPPHAVADSFAIQFVYERGGKKFEFEPANLPADLATYRFIERKDKLVRKGNAEPAIKGFALSGVTNEDSAAVVLAQPAAVLYFYTNERSVPPAVKDNLVAVYKAAAAKKVPVYVISNSLQGLHEGFDMKDAPDLQFFKIDFTAFRTAARTNPTLYFLQNGTIVEKESRHRSGKILQRLAAIR